MSLISPLSSQSRAIYRQPLIILVAMLSLVWMESTAAASINPFPLYPSIKSNVAFWAKVYAKYPSNRGFIHDSDDLAVIYEVINVKKPNEPGSRRYNKKKIQQAKAKYHTILTNLASGKGPANSEEKRVAALFRDNASKKIFTRAVDNIRFQRCIKDRFQEGLIRSGKYIDQIKQIFIKEGLPPDLAYLPHVESSYNYQAYSKFGAAGMWQFIRSTGRRFMTINYTLDERRDPIISSIAAAKYLKENYQKLQSWPLSLTAYNHGAGSMARAQKQLGGYEQVFNHYENRRFGFASRNFYSEFLAAREIAKHYQKYFTVTPALPVKTQLVEMKGFVPIKEIANHFNITTDTIKSLNQALRKPVYTGQKYVPKGYQLRIPAQKNFKRLAQIPANLYKKEQKRSRFHRVQRGETAGKIARIHKVRLQDLQETNQLNRRSTIYVGQNLRIPGLSEKSKTTIISARISKTPATITATTKKTPQTVAKPKESIPPFVKTDPEPIIPADTSTEAKELAQADTKSINPTILIGNFQVEKIFSQNGKQIGLVQVEYLETLGHYADWLGIPTSDIRRLNKFSFNRSIRTHQKIKIPLSKVNKEQFEEQRYEFHKEIEEDFFTAYRIVGVQDYTIKNGDTIWTLCRNDLDVPFWLMKKYNPTLDFEALQPAQKLIIPVVDDVS